MKIFKRISFEKNAQKYFINDPDHGSRDETD